MTDLFLQMALSNACFALALALVAMAVGAKARRPHLAHLLWLLVFVKLVTPPLVTIPVGAFAQQPDHAGAGARAFVAGVPSAVAEAAPASPPLSRVAPIWNRTKPCLAALWLLGSVVVLVWSLARVCRFGCLLAAQSDMAPEELHREAERIARRLGLVTTPTICTTSARLSPLVWWTGGPVRIVIPRALLDQMDAQDWQWILAHELAHVRRRDYLVRWIEWLACVCFWWNPVVWWAQRNLRATEEICCDDLVLSCLNPKPKSYADSLLSAVEFLARPAVRAPAMASEINSGGSLERRFRMIVSQKPNRSNSRWSRICVLVCTLAVLPLGLVSAQDYEAVGKRLKESVQKGEITQQQAETVMATLKKESVKKAQSSDKTTAGPAKVKKDLGAAVESGKIRKKAAQKDQDTDKATAYLMQVKKDLGAAVEAGKISKEDAAKKYEAAQRDLQKKMAVQGQNKVDLEAAWKKLQAKVRAGELTKEQAHAQMATLKHGAAQTAQDSDKATTYLMQVKKDLGAAVEAGKISKEDAAKKYEAAQRDLQKKMAVQGQNKVDLEAAWKKLQAKVRAGELTKEQAHAQMATLKHGAAQTAQDSDKATTGPTKVRKDLGDAAKIDKVNKKDGVKKHEAAGDKDGK